MLTPKQMQDRIEFAKAVLLLPDSFFDHLVFSDESWMIVADMSKFAWQKIGVDEVDIYECAHPTKRMVWAGISAQAPYITKLHFCEFEEFYKQLPKGYHTKAKGLGALYYSEAILKQEWADWVKRHPHAILRDDGASAHKKSFMPAFWAETEGIGKSMRFHYKIDWPANSPDLNPIENFWAVMKVMKNRACVNSAQGMEAALKQWRDRLRGLRAVRDASVCQGVDGRDGCPSSARRFQQWWRMGALGCFQFLNSVE